MMKKILLFQLLIVGMTLLLFPSCNGILSSVYDDPDQEDVKEFGFIEVDKTTNSGMIYIDTHNYTSWTYINFKELTANSVFIEDGMVEPNSWDFAVHRYDAKTNGGSVIETGFTGLSTLKTSGKIPEGTYVEDVFTTNRIAIDMSGMLEGNIKYVDSNYNAELSKWLNVDTSGMPPTYTMSNKVYVIQLKDDTYAAVRLKNFMNASAIKGYMTIEYIYPLTF